MSALSNTFEASSLKTNEKQYLKNSLDREYKLLTANQSVFSHSKNIERETLDGSRDQFWKEASIRSERKPSNKEISAPAEGFTVDNNYYKHEIQNLRSSLNEMRDKALKTKMMTSELRTTNTRQLEQASDLEKERVKKLQAEREEDVAESLSYREGLRSPLERNHIDSAGKKKVKMAYEQKEKEIYERVLGSSAKKQKEDYVHSNWNSAGSYKDEFHGRSPNGLPREDENPENEQKEVREFSASKDQGYFTNKELVRAKYEQYEKDLLKKKEKGQHKRKAEDGQKEDSSLENSVEKKFDRSEVSGKKQSSLYPVPEETENDRAHEKSVSYKREYNSRENHDEFGKALEKRERKLQEEYDNIEKEKSWRNRGLVYREYDQPEEDDEERLEPKVQYATKQFPNSDFLALELEKLKDENQRIKREIKDIQKRNDIERRHYSAKLTQEDFQMTRNLQNHSGSKKLNKLKNQRKIEDEWAFSEVVKGDDIRKTIDRARKSVHKKMEGAKQERSWKEARNKSTANITEDVFIGYKTRSRSPQFHAGIPSNHLRESAFLLARGIPTRYVSNRGLGSLSQSMRSATSRSLRK